jgi:NADH-quinone oxidoreductase subunit K
VGVILNQKSIINVLLSVELMLLSVNVNMVAFSAYFQEMTGQIFAIFILTVAAAEAAVGLAIIINYYRNRGSIAIKDVNEMQG